MNTYEYLFFSYLILAVLTVLPTTLSICKGVPLNPGGASFNDCVHFSEKGKKQLTDHYTRLMGTLGFWKKRAEVYTTFHYYCVIWTILASWSVPIIACIGAQAKETNFFSQALIVLVSGHVALVLSLHKGLKIADGMKAFRHGESEFYDLYRRLLDRPIAFGNDENNQIDKYFSEVEKIRRLVRNSETDSLPTLDDIKIK